MGVKIVELEKVTREIEIIIEINTLEALAEQIDRQIELLRQEKDALRNKRLIAYIGELVESCK